MIVLGSTQSGRVIRATLIALFFALPLASGLVNRLIDRDSFSMPDYGAVACAAERMVSGQPLYVLGQRTNCEAYESPPYLYPPLLAGLEAGVQASFGMDGARRAYLALYLISLVFIGWRIFMSDRTPGSVSVRIPYLGLIPATPIWQANVATVSHAAVLFASAAAWRAPSVFAVIVLCMAAIKPSFLVYLLVLACLPFPFWKRVILTFVPVVVVAIGLAAFVALGSEAEVWRRSVAFVVTEWVPGNGSLAMIARLGVPSGIAVACALAFAVIIALAAVVICEIGEADLEQRVFIALAAAIIMMPRVMPYDVMLVAPGMVSMIKVVKAVRPAVGTWVGRLAMTGCVVAVLMSLAGYADQRLDVALLCFACAFLLGAGALAPRDLWRFVMDAERRAARMEHASKATAHTSMPRHEDQP